MNNINTYKDFEVFLKDLSLVNKDWHENDGQCYWLFRGHGKAGYHLKPSITRDNCYKSIFDKTQNKCEVLVSLYKSTEASRIFSPIRVVVLF